MRLLGVDFGSKRIGLATGYDDPPVASARKGLVASGSLKVDAKQILAIATDEEVELIIVGIPVNEEDSRMARICGKLAEELRVLGASVEEVDETFTSVEAEAALVEAGASAAQRRDLRDGEAARRILERFLERR